MLFDNVQLFDADKGVFVANQAVLAQGGKIAAIGAAGSVKAPAGARVIDGGGKTLVPGIWDSHMHIGDDWDVLANMANGMTSFRSPGTTFDRAVDATKRRASGELLMGEPFISGDHRPEGSARGAGRGSRQQRGRDRSPRFARSRTPACGASNSTPR